MHSSIEKHGFKPGNMADRGIRLRARNVHKLIPIETAMSETLNIAHLANLARLSLDTEAVTATEQDLGNIIAMIDRMQAVNTDDVEPMAHPLDATQRLREDRVTETVDTQKFQAHAPATEQGYYLVPRVVE